MDKPSSSAPETTAEKPQGAPEAPASVNPFDGLPEINVPIDIEFPAEPSAQPAPQPVADQPVAPAADAITQPNVAVPAPASAVTAPVGADERDPFDEITADVVVPSPASAVTAPVGANEKDPFEEETDPGLEKPAATAPDSAPLADPVDAGRPSLDGGLDNNCDAGQAADARADATGGTPPWWVTPPTTPAALASATAAPVVIPEESKTAANPKLLGAATAAPATPLVEPLGPIVVKPTGVGAVIAGARGRLQAAINRIPSKKDAMAKIAKILDGAKSRLPARLKKPIPAPAAATATTPTSGPTPSPVAPNAAPTAPIDDEDAEIAAFSRGQATRKRVLAGVAAVVGLGILGGTAYKLTGSDTSGTTPTPTVPAKADKDCTFRITLGDSGLVGTYPFRGKPLKLGETVTGNICFKVNADSRSCAKARTCDITRDSKTTLKAACDMEKVETGVPSLSFDCK